MLEPYDPHFPRNVPSSSDPPDIDRPTAGRGDSRAAAIQTQIDDTVTLMRENVVKLTERQERLESLESRTENLSVSAQTFRRTANRVRKNMWWQDMKMRIIIGVSITVILSLIIFSIVKAVQK